MCSLKKGRRGKGNRAYDTKLIRYGDGCVLYEPMEKRWGIRNMLDHFGMKPNQAVVFGDGYNDLSMFRPEWFNIAMGNGPC